MTGKILITGGTGAMGSVFVRKLTSEGFSVEVLTLPGDPFVSRLHGTGANIHYGDISSPEDLQGICDGVDTVFHLAAVIITDDDTLFDSVNMGGTRNILGEALRSGVKHFVHISSASVVYTKSTPYSISKRVAERLVRESGVPYTIVRPTLVYGREGGLEFDMFLSYLSKFPVVPFIGDGHALKRPVYVDDIIDGLVKIAELGTATGKIYNFSGGKAISMIDFSYLCLVLMGAEDKRAVHLPVWVCLLLARFLRKIMKNPPLKWNMIAGVIQDANLDPSEAVKDLGYKPSSVADRLPECFPRK